MKKNIGLVFYYNESNRYSFNALAGALEVDKYFDNLDTYFIDEESALISELEKIFQRYERIVLCFSFFTIQAQEIRKIVKNLKESFSRKLFLIAGGPHATGKPADTLEMGFDIAVVGEGEETFTEILHRLREGRDYRDVRGIAFIEDGEYRFTGLRPSVNLDNYPPFSIKYEKAGAIEITRGCPYGCYFCQTPYIAGTRPRHRSVESICRYVEIMNERWRNFYVRLITPNAFSYGSPDGRVPNLQELERLLSSIRKILGRDGKIYIGTFPSEVRPEFVSREAIDLVLKYADNDNLIIGAQSGSQRMLDLCHRGHTVRDIYNATEITLGSGLKARLDFIFGLPGETDEDLDLTVKVIKDLIKKGARVNAHVFSPLPQTPFEKSPPGKIHTKIMNLIGKCIPEHRFRNTERECVYG